MSRTVWRLTRSAAFAATLTASIARGEVPTTIWSGTSGGFFVTWTTTDIYAQRGDRLVFAARDWASAGLSHFIAVNRTPEDPRPPDCDYVRRLRVLALVGPLMSLEDSTEVTCRQEAHPGGMTRLITIDLANPEPLIEAGLDAIGTVDMHRPGKAVLLTGLFPAEDVVKALTAAAPIRVVLRRSGEQPATVPALLDAVVDATGGDEGCYIIPPDLLARFAFERQERGRVVVRLGLPGDGLCRLTLTEAELDFAVPEELAASLRSAADGSAGLLAQESARIASGRSTTIVMQSGRGGGAQ